MKQLYPDDPDGYEICRSAAGQVAAGTLPACVVVLWSAGCGLFRVDVVGDAMAPTLRHGESALATRRVIDATAATSLASGTRATSPRASSMRIIALPGEEIVIKEGSVIINGRPLDEP